MLLCNVSCTSQDHVCLLLSAFLSTTCFSDLTDVNSGSLDCALWLHCCQLAALVSTDGRSVWAVLIVQLQPVVVASSLTFLGSAAGQCRVYTLCPPARAPAPRPGHSDQLAAGWGMFACYVGCSEPEFAKISNVTVPCKDVFPSAIEIHGQKSWLIDIPTPETGFLVLETLPETMTESRSLHAISL